MTISAKLFLILIGDLFNNLPLSDSVLTEFVEVCLGKLPVKFG